MYWAIMGHGPNIAWFIGIPLFGQCKDRFGIKFIKSRHESFFFCQMGQTYICSIEAIG